MRAILKDYEHGDRVECEVEGKLRRGRVALAPVNEKTLRVDSFVVRLDDPKSGARLITVPREKMRRIT